jgi:CHC2 zinc finger
MSLHDATIVRRLLTDPLKLCTSLGLLDGAKRQGGGLLVRCPAHSERTPSCSVTPGPDGTVRARCFGCDWSGDALTLIAAVRGLSLRSSADFRGVLSEGAEIGGDHALASELRAGASRVDRELPPALPLAPPREYPPIAEVRELWDSAVSVEADPDAWEWLRSRGVDPRRVFESGVARVLPLGTKVPPWARYGAANWVATGHRLLIPVLDAAGTLRSVRACRIEEPRDCEVPEGLELEAVRRLQAERPSVPKRLPPAGCKASGLVMANRLALLMLRGHACPVRLVVVEGEPDFFTHATHSEDAVLGIVSGSWSDDFARAVPTGTRVFIRTHNDAAGDRYAATITDTLAQRCGVWR